MSNIRIIVFVVARNPIGGLKIVNNVIGETLVLVQHGTRLNIVNQQEDITYRKQRILLYESLILMRFQVQISTILNLLFQMPDSYKQIPAQPLTFIFLPPVLEFLYVRKKVAGSLVIIDETSNIILMFNLLWLFVNDFLLLPIGSFP